MTRPIRDVIVRYLNKREGTIKAIKDRELMQAIIDNTPKDIKRIREQMYNLLSPQLTGMPSAHEPKSGEEKLVNNLTDVEMLCDRYDRAIAYMDWFMPAWEVLSKDEQFILVTFYVGPRYQLPAVDQVSRVFHIERSTAYNRKNQALDKLSVLLFGS